MDLSVQIKNELINGVYYYQSILDDIDKALTKEKSENVFDVDLPLYYFRKAIAESYGLTTAKNYNQAAETLNQIPNICNTQNNKLENNTSELAAQIIMRNKLLITISHREMGIIYFKKNDYQNAYKEFNYDTNDPRSNAYSLMIISYELIYHITPPDMHNMINTTIEILDEMSNNNIEIATYFLGLLYSDNTLKRKNLDKSLSYLKKAQSQGYQITNNEISNIIQNAENDKYKNEFSIAKDKWILARNENTSKKDKSSNGCYVATCVYGSYDCPPVWTLRRYRDYTLAKNPLGRLFIKIYYAISPMAVNQFGNKKWFHQLFKAPLDKIVKKLNNNGVENTPYNGK